MQVNVSGEAIEERLRSRRGGHLARAIGALPQYALRGLMAIPEPTDDTRLQRGRFAVLRDLRETRSMRKAYATRYPVDGHVAMTSKTP
jgi:uncharacterized pyridoxal phosphate-containing UPF0001 family protein